MWGAGHQWTGALDEPPLNVALISIHFCVYPLLIFPSSIFCPWNLQLRVDDSQSHGATVRMPGGRSHGNILCLRTSLPPSFSFCLFFLPFPSPLSFPTCQKNKTLLLKIELLFVLLHRFYSFNGKSKKQKTKIKPRTRTVVKADYLCTAHSLFLSHCWHPIAPTTHGGRSEGISIAPGLHTGSWMASDTMQMLGGKAYLFIPAFFLRREWMIYELASSQQNLSWV